jgi:hypothetical protein
MVIIQSKGEKGKETFSYLNSKTKEATSGIMSLHSNLSRRTEQGVGAAAPGALGHQPKDFLPWTKRGILDNIRLSSQFSA